MHGLAMLDSMQDVRCCVVRWFYSSQAPGWRWLSKYLHLRVRAAASCRRRPRSRQFRRCLRDSRCLALSRGVTHQDDAYVLGHQRTCTERHKIKIKVPGSKCIRVNQLRGGGVPIKLNTRKTLSFDTRPLERVHLLTPAETLVSHRRSMCLKQAGRGGLCASAARGRCLGCIRAG